MIGRDDTCKTIAGKTILEMVLSEIVLLSNTSGMMNVKEDAASDTPFKGEIVGESSLRIVLAGGGTGGHLYPAIAIAEAFAKRVPHCEFMFIGTAQGLEARVLPQLGYRLELVPVRGLIRKFTWSNLAVPMQLLQSVRRCLQLFREFQPNLIIGTGGYVSGPALLAAWFSRRKFVIQEQNNFPGLVNLRLGNRADAVFLSFEESRKFFPRQKHAHVVGNPVRANLQQRTQPQREAAARKWNLDANKTTLLVFGGSQGARRINELILELLPRLMEIGSLQILWGVGPSHFDKIAPHVQQHTRVAVVAYLEDMNLAYALADFVVCRAGASTIFELLLCALPAILIPFPFATADHQTFNARALEKAGAARLLMEKDLRVEELFEAIRALASEASLRMRMAEAARKLSRPHAAEEIVDACLKVIDTSRN
ncbi:undecaprenyldiphospho-muramoylpentapeptide beta-N-acetylglucosaminyltransferase [candidate division KSB1 bacterium]|nr:undecaprenyldiphospho-muramoylpentapeptide beta-N-acetylglucosaminyltransferase [candidate division KSB1 bacterium]